MLVRALLRMGSGTSQSSLWLKPLLRHSRQLSRAKTGQETNTSSLLVYASPRARSRTANHHEPTQQALSKKRRGPELQRAFSSQLEARQEALAGRLETAVLGHRLVRVRHRRLLLHLVGRLLRLLVRGDADAPPAARQPREQEQVLVGPLRQVRVGHALEPRRPGHHRTSAHELVQRLGEQLGVHPLHGEVLQEGSDGHRGPGAGLLLDGVEGEVEAGLAPRVDEVGRTLGGWGCGGTGGWARVLSSAGSEGGVVGGGGVLCIVLPGELQALPPAGMPVGSAFGGRGGAALRGRGNP
eukprot:971274-Prorocentrum_minimum.AAC.2